MKTRISLILLAILCTAISLLLTQKYVEDKLQEKTVVVFRQDIQPFTKLSREMLELAKVGANGLHAQSARQISEVEGLFVDSKAVTGEIVLKNKLFSEGQLPNGYLYKLKPEERVIAVSTDLTRSVGGTVNSGDIVDLIAVLDEKSGGEPLAKTIVQQIKVIDVRDQGAQKILRGEDKGEPRQEQIISNPNRKMVPGAVLLAVSPSQAEQIVLYQKLGEITLSVNPKDGKAFVSGGVRLSQLRN